MSTGMIWNLKFCCQFKSILPVCLFEPRWMYEHQAFMFLLNIADPSPCLLIYWCKVVELDFLYPSEGIHRRWESGYRITSMAATADQAAFILSIPKRKTMDETQETLRTSAFPSTHVKVGACPYCPHIKVVQWVGCLSMLPCQGRFVCFN